MGDRTNSCALFRDGRCRHQLMMEKVYLIPQILGASIFQKYEAMCCQCGEYKNGVGKILCDPFGTPAFVVASPT